MTEYYGVKVSNLGFPLSVTDPRDLSFSSTRTTYMLAKTFTVVVSTDPQIIVHGLGYVPKVFVYHILSSYNRKLPYDDGTKRDFSVTKDVIKIRGVTSGTFKVFVFSQEIL